MQAAPPRRDTPPWDKEEHVKRGLGSPIIHHARPSAQILTLAACSSHQQHMHACTWSHMPSRPGPYYWEHMDAANYHIITNRYFDRNHEAAVQQEQAEARAKAADAFYKTNHYNPITGQFYHPDLEDEFQRQRHIQGLTHGQDKLNRLPLAYKKSDGMVYNIIAPSLAHDPTELARREAESREKSLPSLKVRIEKDMEAKRIAREDLRLARSINRVAEERFEVPLARGYDIITNVPYRGRLGQPPVNNPNRRPKQLDPHATLSGSHRDFPPSAVSPTYNPEDIPYSMHQAPSPYDDFTRPPDGDEQQYDNRYPDEEYENALFHQQQAQTVPQ